MNALPPLRAVPLVLAFPALLAGCMNMSGVGGSSTYSCKAPEGVACDSMSGIYANAIQGNLPGQRRSAATPDPATQPTSPATLLAARPLSGLPPVATPDDRPSPFVSQPLRSQARVLRLWTKPWEDADGDLYDQGYIYVQVENGRWLIDHVQQQVRDAYAPVRPPPAAPANAPTPAEEAAAAASTAIGFPGAAALPRPSGAATPLPSFGLSSGAPATSALPSPPTP